MFKFALKSQIVLSCLCTISSLNVRCLLMVLKMNFIIPGIDIERTVKDSIRIFNHTPPSIGLRRCDNPANRTKAPEEEKFIQLPVRTMFSISFTSYMPFTLSL